MLLESVTIAKSLMRPWQVGHARTSISNVLFRSSAHGRYPPLRFGSRPCSLSVEPSVSGQAGAMRERQRLAAARTPAYFTSNAEVEPPSPTDKAGSEGPCPPR